MKGINPIWIYVVSERMNKMFRQGDVSFYRDGKNIYQQFLDGPIALCNGEPLNNEFIQQIGSCSIQFDRSGIFGFSIWKDGQRIRDKIWTANKAIKLASMYARQTAKAEVFAQMKNIPADDVAAA